MAEFVKKTISTRVDSSDDVFVYKQLKALYQVIHKDNDRDWVMTSFEPSSN